MGQLKTSIRDKDTTLQSRIYQDADDAKRTAYSQAVNAAATILNKTAGGNTPKADEKSNASCYASKYCIKRYSKLRTCETSC